MSKLLRIAPVVMLFAATTFLAPVVPAKDKNKDKTASAQTTETTGKDAKSHKGKHHKAGQQSDSSSTASTAEKSGTPKN